MDDLDRKVILELEENSRKTYLEIAKKLRVSEGTVRKRVKKMLKKGILKFTVFVTTKVGFSSIVLIKTSPQTKTSSIVERIKKLKEVKEIFEVTGDVDIIIKVLCNNAEEFNEVIEKVREIPNILETRTYTILKISWFLKLEKILKELLIFKFFKLFINLSIEDLKTFKINIK